jgi:hypothetical protein
MAIDNMFRDCLSSHGKSVTDSIREDIMKNISEEDLSVRLASWAELAGGGEKGEVALKNLEGDDEVINLASLWVAPDERGLKKLQKIQDYFPESLKVRLEKGVSYAKAKVQALAEERLKEDQARSEQSEETDDDLYDDRGNTAHRVFAGSSFVLSERSPSAFNDEEAGFHTPASSPRRFQEHRQILTASPTPPSTIFNQEYADWFTPITPPNRRLGSLPKTPEPTKVMNILSPSTNKANSVHPVTASKPRLAATPNPTPQTLLPSNLVLASSSSSTSTLLSGHTKRNSKTPPSPNTIARRDKRRAERKERQRIALKLGRARPDLVSKEFTEKLFGPAQEDLC